jgi:hypothetical protein
MKNLSEIFRNEFFFLAELDVSRRKELDLLFLKSTSCFLKKAWNFSNQKKDLQ